MSEPKQQARKLVAENRRARFDYFLEESVEAGLVLTGSEVKSLRLGRANIAESYASVEGGEMVLINAYIPEYPGANRFNHEPKRARKLLLRRQLPRPRQILAPPRSFRPRPRPRPSTRA